MELQFSRTFKVERLFFRYIQGSELSARGITAAELARALESEGFIELLDDGSRYSELPKFQPHSGRWDFQRLWGKPTGVLFEKLKGKPK